MPHPRSLLRIEGLLVAAGTTAAYFLLDYTVLVFVALVLVPDLSMAGYLVDSRWGARTYNVVHTYVGPAALGVAGWSVGVDLALAAALVWAVHIGADRPARGFTARLVAAPPSGRRLALFGFGLKYGDAEFADTHVQRV